MMPLDTFNGTSGDDTYTGTSGDDTINGFAGDDTLSGGDGDDKIYGGDDNDVLSGGTGNDILDAGTGNNTLDGGDDNDTLYSHGGVDTVTGGAGTDTWYADYSARATPLSFDQKTGRFSDGTTVQQVENVVITSGYGKDSFTLDGSTNCAVDGGPGKDTLKLDYSDGTVATTFSIHAASDSTLSASAEGATNCSATDMESINLKGGSGDDVITVDAVSEAQYKKLSIDGGDATDRLSLDFSNLSSVSFAVADDGTISSSVGTFHDVEAFTLLLSAGSNSITLGDYDDVITTTAGGHDVIHTGNGNNMVSLSGASDTVYAGDGNDHIDIHSTSATIDAGGGDDSLSVYKAGQVTIDGGDGNDSLEMVLKGHSLTFDQATGKFSDGSSISSIKNLELILDGKEYDYTINLNSAGNTTIVGQAPNSINVDLSSIDSGLSFIGHQITTHQSSLKFGETLIDNPGGIHIVGTAGNDIFQFDSGFCYSHPLADFNLDGGGGNNELSIEAYGANTFIVNADGTITTDQGKFANFQQFELVFGAGDNVVTTGAGDDTITAGSNTGQHNVLDGGGGNDMIYSGAGDDLIRGSAGDDLLSGGDGNDVLNGGDGNDILDGGNGIDTASYRNASAGVHVAIVSGQQDTGGAGLDLLSSIENLTGSSFDDKLTGDGGANTLIGAQGDDKLIGGAGDDVLEGGAGKDQMTGGAGADRFVFDALADLDAKGGDKITDFSHATGDIIDLTMIDPDPHRAVLAATTPIILAAGHEVDLGTLASVAQGAGEVDADLLYVKFDLGAEAEGPRTITALFPRDEGCHVKLECRFWQGEDNRIYLIPRKSLGWISFDADGMNFQRRPFAKPPAAGYARAASALQAGAAEMLCRADELPGERVAA